MIKEKRLTAFILLFSIMAMTSLIGCGRSRIDNVGNNHNAVDTNRSVLADHFMFVRRHHGTHTAITGGGERHNDKMPLTHHGLEAFVLLLPYSFIVTSFPGLKANTSMSPYIVIQPNSHMKKNAFCGENIQ